ncbi:DUF4852 domain-containing protein [Azotobacter vinelandii]|uniref:DUF4852 domain-containing protein n=1 Tax=Azotobacter vinelandii TaxID=354 RepID=UPI0026651787|nr:DUF4852 domain-containing protein [Azotobacter vinelandii]WKN23094.1 DUF4852 domain-containing protein [Azotobacter vinelandii]
MKKLAGMVLLSLSTGAIAGGTLINDNNVFYYYESRADIRTPDTKLAEMISVDYRTARDEFTRHDLFERIKPVLEEKLNQAKANNLVTFQITGNLGEYDFERKAFPTGFGKGSYIPFGNSYAATFENAEDLSFIDIPPEQARTFSSALQKGRRISIELEGTPVAAKEDNLDWNHTKALVIKVTKMTITLANGGTRIGEKHL